MVERVNPFPHTDAFWRLRSRQLFENTVTKEEIAQNEQFLLLPQCFPLLVISYPFNYRDFQFFGQNMFKVACCRIVVWGKGLISVIMLNKLCLICKMPIYTILSHNAETLSHIQRFCSRKIRKYLLNPFPHPDAFWRLCSRRLSKTFWQKEKLLIMSIFSICYNVFA